MPAVLFKEMGSTNYEMAITLRYGRTAMDDEDIELLCQMTQGFARHVEIGTLWGGSAIAVALANPDLSIVCIDPFDGYYGTYDKWAQGDTPTIQKVMANIYNFGVEKRIQLVQARSKPWPVEGKFDTAFIDGDHNYFTVVDDWDSCRWSGCKRIAVHDWDDPDVKAAVEDRITDERKTYEQHDWKVWAQTKRMTIFERCHESD